MSCRAASSALESTRTASAGRSQQMPVQFDGRANRVASVWMSLRTRFRAKPPLGIAEENNKTSCSKISSLLPAVLSGKQRITSEKRASDDGDCATHGARCGLTSANHDKPSCHRCRHFRKQDVKRGSSGRQGVNPAVASTHCAKGGSSISRHFASCNLVRHQS